MILRLAVWDILLVGLLLSPVLVGGLFIESMRGLLTAEIVPGDQNGVPVPRPGEEVEIYGTWVKDTGHLGDFGWNEIHPAIFVRNLDSGVEGGTLQCKHLEGVHDAARLRILDTTEPCKWARGRVLFVFTFSDGDLHIDLQLDSAYQDMASTGAPAVTISYPAAQFLVWLSPLSFGLLYSGASAIRPRKTVLGRFLLRFSGKN